MQRNARACARLWATLHNVRYVTFLSLRWAFMPHHIVDGVKKILEDTTQKYVPVHEIMV